MKKMKKLNLNKISIVSLKNLNAIHGGNSGQGAPDTNTCQIQYSMDPLIDCDSTGITYGGNDDGSLQSAPLPQTQACSMVLTECELAPM
ncbi:hypothetical protein [Kordia jejudonensis]|uniref:hypothetical protein n=1 Tax=Kordia jejudonensis TaxID=1348245 RepID=UPI0006292ED9|nr:hypothetical protein [Kordia jejudonensis]